MIYIKRSTRHYPYKIFTYGKVSVFNALIASLLHVFELKWKALIIMSMFMNVNLRGKDEGLICTHLKIRFQKNIKREFDQLTR